MKNTRVEVTLIYNFERSFQYIQQTISFIAYTIVSYFILNVRKNNKTCILIYINYNIL